MLRCCMRQRNEALRVFLGHHNWGQYGDYESHSLSGVTFAHATVSVVKRCGILEILQQ